MVNTVNREILLVDEAQNVVESILEGLGMRIKEYVLQVRDRKERKSDLTIYATSGKAKVHFAVEVRSRITPQTALSISEQVRNRATGMIPVVFAPVISPRVAEILRKQGVGYFDRAGNCWLRSQDPPLLIERQGMWSMRDMVVGASAEQVLPKSDPFSPKSSRIVRLMLSQPAEGWQVRKLAEHPDVNVSPGLVVKVKRALVEEGYAVERARMLYLRDPVGLLAAWAGKYPGPAEQVPMYFRGEPAVAEKAVSRWCEEHSLRYALAGFSAAWRLAPEVRYAVAAVYVDERGFEKPKFAELATQLGGKRVDTGANLYLWRPFDRSVFAGTSEADEASVTSALQTYLDLKRTPGRGEDAANAVFEKYLSRELHAAANREEERQRGAV